MDFQSFVPLAKVAPHKREVTGILTQEMPDHDGEIMDYETSKPYFMAWSAMVHQDSQGKSLGNLRRMHQPTVIGKLTDIQFDDALKRIQITSKVSDDDDWKKVLNGEYTGYSVGGSYVDKWEDGRVLSSGKKAVRFTADPYEASLVDRPSVPSALFTGVKMIKMVKPDGTEEDISLSDLNQMQNSPASSDIVVKGLGEGDEVLIKRISRRGDVKPEEGLHQYGNVEFADPTNKKYPIDTEEHIRAAWNYINKEKDASKYSPEEVSEIKSRIIAAWKRKIDAKGPPSAREGRKFVDPEMAKGLMRAGELAFCISQLAEFAQSQVIEDKLEGQEKPSKVPKKVYNSIKELVPILSQYIEEESQELLTSVASATSPEAAKMSGNAGSTGEALSRFDAVTKGVQDLVGLLKGAREDDDEEKARKAREDEDEAEKGISDDESKARKERNMKRKEKARKARESDEDEDEHEKGISDHERKARKERNEKREKARKERKAAEEKAKKEEEEKKRKETAAAGGDLEKTAILDVVKAVNDLTEAVTPFVESTQKEIKVLKGVILMQAEEIQNLREAMVRKRAPLAPLSDGRFMEQYQKAVSGSGSGSGESFADALKGIYQGARGE